MPPTIPNFELIRLIGEGGFGEVWLARTVTGKLRAVKWIRRDRFERPGLSAAGTEALFQMEFQGVQRFEDIAASTPELISILLVGRAEKSDAYYYVMPLADSLHEEESSSEYQPRTLAAELASGVSFSWSEALEMITRLARGVAKLHEIGLQHGDISPANVLLIDGKTVLADPGLTSLTDDTVRARSPGYSDPGGLSDVYSLGRLCYHLVTGKHPIESFPIVPPDKRAQIVAGTFATILDRCCHPEKEERFADAGELVEFLAPGSQRPSPSPWKILFTVLAVLSISLLGWLAYDRFFPPPPSHAKVSNGRLSVFASKNGRLLWSKPIAGELREAHVIDLDEDGSPEILCAVEHLTPQGSGCLHAYTEKGDLLWSFETTPKVQNYSGYEGQEMGLHGLVIEDFDGKPGKEIMILTRNALDWFPTTLQFVNSNGNQYATYWHPGHIHIEDIRVYRRSENERPFILFHALNNRLGTPLAELDEDHRTHAKVLAMIDPTIKGLHEAPPGTGILNGKDEMTVWYRQIIPQFVKIQHFKIVDREKDGTNEIIATIKAWRGVVHERDHITYHAILDEAGELIEAREGDGHRHEVTLQRIMQNK